MLCNRKYERQHFIKKSKPNSTCLFLANIFMQPWHRNRLIIEFKSRVGIIVCRRGSQNIIDSHCWDYYIKQKRFLIEISGKEDKNNSKNNNNKRSKLLAQKNFAKINSIITFIKIYIYVQIQKKIYLFIYISI